MPFPMHWLLKKSSYLHSSTYLGHVYELQIGMSLNDPRSSCRYIAVTRFLERRSSG